MGKTIRRQNKKFKKKLKSKRINRQSQRSLDIENLFKEPKKFIDSV